MRVHAIASTEQYERHIRAVWKHLDDGLRGEFLTGPQAVGSRLPRGDVVMVGGAQDIPKAGQHDLVYVEHGAGQSYAGDPKMLHNRGYPGAIHPPNVRWYICPRQDVADSWGRPAVVAGCPALDGIDRAVARLPLTAVITFHWNAQRLCPEAGSAAEFYLPRIDEIIAWLHDAGFAVFGHWHPRSPTMRAMWRDHDLMCLPEIDRVLELADLLICDNSSVMYEAGALGIPVIALNSPRYRRDVEHGLRFWDAIPGWQVDDVDQLLALDVARYWAEDWSLEQRRRATEYCYGGVPIGGAGAAAAAWLSQQLLG